MENFGKTAVFPGRFSGRIWPDWGNTAWADMAGLGSKGLSYTPINILVRYPL